MLAESFFRNAKLSNCLDMYDRALRDNAKGYLDNSFQHELGHGLGLRHKFIPGEGNHICSESRRPAHSWHIIGRLQQMIRTSRRRRGSVHGSNQRPILTSTLPMRSKGFQKGAKGTVMARSGGIGVCLMYFFLSINVYVLLELAVMNALSFCDKR